MFINTRLRDDWAQYLREYKPRRDDLPLFYSEHGGFSATTALYIDTTDDQRRHAVELL